VIPQADTIIYVDEELPGAKAWAKRHEVPLEWLPEQLELRATLTQPDTNDLYFLRARFDNYREIAPEWVFTDAMWTADPRQNLFPKPESLPNGKSSMIHAQPVICAPFNRLAYKVLKGPHQDWGGPASWLTAGGPDDVKAYCVGDMLSAIHRHFSVTRKRMG